MLRALKTLQPENDTRRLHSMSMNRTLSYRDLHHIHSGSGAVDLVLGKTTEIRGINLNSLTNFK
jgi:hypothetical protein